MLRIHQVRYGVDLLPYDVAWIGSAVLLLLIGMLILWRTRPAAAPGTRPLAGNSSSTDTSTS